MFGVMCLHEGVDDDVDLPRGFLDAARGFFDEGRQGTFSGVGFDEAMVKVDVEAGVSGSPCSAILR